VERRLAAVLAADVAGYSRLMGADEEGTLARLKAARKNLLAPTLGPLRRSIPVWRGARPCGPSGTRGMSLGGSLAKRGVALHFAVNG
jgi:hypothetical protein